MPRLFVAVWPPPQVVGALRALPRAEEPGVRWVPEANWHVTLRFLGQADPHGVADRLVAAGPLPGARAVLGPAVEALGRSVVSVPVAGLDRLAAAVVEATSVIGDPPDPRPFAAHLTLARRKGRARCSLVGAPIDGSFTVDEVALVESEQENDGVAYRTVERFGLSRL